MRASKFAEDVESKLEAEQYRVGMLEEAAEADEARRPE